MGMTSPWGILSCVSEHGLIFAASMSYGLSSWDSFNKRVCFARLASPWVVPLAGWMDRKTDFWYLFFFKSVNSTVFVPASVQFLRVVHLLPPKGWCMRVCACERARMRKVIFYSNTLHDKRVSMRGGCTLLTGEREEESASWCFIQICWNMKGCHWRVVAHYWWPFVVTCSKSCRLCDCVGKVVENIFTVNVPCICWTWSWNLRCLKILEPSICVTILSLCHNVQGFFHKNVINPLHVAQW